MKAWLARDKDGALWLYLDEKPYKTLSKMWNTCGEEFYKLGHEKFPEVKWEDEESTEVEIIIKLKKQ